MSITDSVGANLWRNLNFSSDPKTYKTQFWSAGVLDGQIDGEILLRRIPRIQHLWDFSRVLATPLRDLLVSELQQQKQRARPHPGERMGLNPQPLPPRLARYITDSQLPESVLSLSPQQLAVHAAATQNKLNEKGESSLASRKLSELHTVHQSLSPVIDALRRQSSVYGADFTHTFQGSVRGRIRYMMKYRLAQTSISGPIDRAEENTISMTGLGGNQPITSIAVQRDKQLSIEHQVRLGMSSDFLRVQLNGLPAKIAQRLQLSIRPGLSAIDIVTGDGLVDIPIQVERFEGGATHIQNFTLPLEGGARIFPASTLGSGSLKTGKIDLLFGEIHNPAALPSS